MAPTIDALATPFESLLKLATKEAAIDTALLATVEDLVKGSSHEDIFQRLMAVRADQRDFIDSCRSWSGLESRCHQFTNSTDLADLRGPDTFDIETSSPQIGLPEAEKQHRAQNRRNERMEVNRVTALLSNTVDIAIIGLSDAEKQLRAENRQNEMMEINRITALLSETVDIAMNTFCRIQEKSSTLAERLSQAHTELIRPLMRPLTILDLPMEVLDEISRYVRDDEERLLETDLDFNINNEWGRFCDVTSIKNLRLACHRLCSASSRFLLRHIDVALTPDSLARLDEVSRHPTISASVLAVRVNLDFCSHRLADCPQFFYNTAIEHMEEEVRRQRAVLAGEQVPRPRYTRIKATDENLLLCQRLVSLWHEFAETMEEPTTGSEEAREDVAALVRAWKVYEKRTNDQKELLYNGKFAPTVAAAMARMPKASRLFITDDKDYMFSFVRKLRRPWAYDTRALLDTNHTAERALDILMLETLRWSEHFSSTERFSASPRSTGEAPVWLLYELLIEISKAATTAVPLKHLSIRMTDPGTALFLDRKPGTFELDDQDQTHLDTLTQTLSVLEYTGPVQPNTRDINRGIDFGMYLRNLTSGNCLQKLDLIAQPFERENTVPPTIGNLLSRMSTAKLRDLQLCGLAIHQSELEKLLSGFGYKQLHISLGELHLRSGTWADVLDLLQAKADFKSWLCVDDQSGAECDDMTEEELVQLDKWWPESASCSSSVASDEYPRSLVIEYIRHSPDPEGRHTMANPFRPVVTEEAGEDIDTGDSG